MSSESIQAKVINFNPNSKRRARKNMIKDKEVDVFVAEQIKKRRKQLGISQISLGNTLGVSFQQVQKYETAGNRVSAGTLQLIAKRLDVPITYFFPRQEYSEDSTAKKVKERLEAALHAIEELKSGNKAEMKLLEQVKSCLLSISFLE